MFIKVFEKSKFCLVGRVLWRQMSNGRSRKFGAGRPAGWAQSQALHPLPGWCWASHASSSLFFSLYFFFKKLSKAPFRSHIHLFFNANWPSQTQQSMRWPVSHQIALVAIIWIGALETSPTPFSCQRRWKRHFWPQHWPLPWTWQCLSHYHFQLVLCPPAGPDFSERV